jgi:hypothetical protein
MLLALLSFTLSVGTTADLSPPFHPDDRGHFSAWEIGGTALIEEQSILLVPAIQYHKGYVWTNVKLPGGNTGLEFEFQIPEGNGGGGLGIWIVDKYLSDGPLNGGPNHFLGIGVLLNVVTGRLPSQGLFLAVRILEISDPQTPPFEINQPSPIAIVSFESQLPFSVSLRFLAENLSVVVNGNEVTNFAVTAQLTDNYLGITAACESRVSRIDLLSVRFLLDENVPSIPTFRAEEVLGEHKPSGHIHKRSTNGLRGAAFNSTIEEYVRMKASKGVITVDGSLDRIFEMIDEIAAVNWEVASFSDLNAFVNEKLLVYAQKWQSRTVKLVERVRNARDVAGLAWNYTQQVMEAFNSSLEHTVLKTTWTIDDLETLLSEVAEEGINEDQAIAKIAEDFNNSRLIRTLMYAAEVEIVVLLIVFLTPLKRKIYGD